MPASRFNLHRFLLPLILSLYLSSCEKDGKLINEVVNVFETDYYEMEFEVEAQDRVGFQIFAEEIFTNNTSSLLSSIGLTEQQIESIILKEAEISFVEPNPSVDFNILKSIELTLYTDSLGDFTVAWLEPVPAGQPNLALVISEENIFPYFQESNFMLTSQGFLHKRLNENLRLKAKVKFLIRTRL